MWVGEDCAVCQGKQQCRSAFLGISSSALGKAEIKFPHPPQLFLQKLMINRQNRKKSKFFREAIQKLNKKLSYDFLQQRKEGFEIQEDMKQTLDLIRRQTEKISVRKQTEKRRKTLPCRGRKKTRKIPLLPELSEFILSRSESSELLKLQRKKIIHLLILGINRRNSEKIIEALDIILIASSYFYSEEKLMRLSSICMILIAKLYKEIKKKVNDKNANLCCEKKRKSLILKNISGINQFAGFFRKMKLLKQSSYKFATRKKNDCIINARCSVVLPTPQELFPSQEYTNYEFITVTMDEKNSLFSYEYPKTISEYMNKQQYRQMICKINGIIFPQRYCFDWDSTLKMYFIPIFLIVLCLLVNTLICWMQIRKSIKIVFSVLFLCLFVLFGVKITLSNEIFKSSIQNFCLIKQYFEQLQEKYNHKLRFLVSEQNDAIFIAIPLDYESDSTSNRSLTEIMEQNEVTQTNRTPLSYGMSEQCYEDFDSNIIFEQKEQIQAEEYKLYMPEQQP